MTPRPEDQHARRAATAVLTGGLVLAGAYFALPGWGQTVTMLGMATVAFVVLAARLRRESLARTGPWSWLLAGVGLYTAALFTWHLALLGPGAPMGFPSPLDAVFFTSYLLYGVFLLGALRRRYASSADASRGLRWRSSTPASSPAPV